MTEKFHPIVVGKRVRSYDFAHRKDVFVEGKLLGYTEIDGSKRYVIEVETFTFKDAVEKAPPGHIVYPPLNGTRTQFNRVTTGVEEIT